MNREKTATERCGPAAAVRRAGAGPALALLAALALLFAVSTAAQAQTETTLVSNAGQTVAGGAAVLHAQSFETGANAYGYTVSEVQVRLHTGGGSDTSVKIREDDSGEPGDLVATLTNPATLTADSFNTFTAPAGTKLDASTTYWISVNEGIDSSRASYARTTGDAESGEPDWSIGNGRLWRASETANWTTSTTNSLLIVIKGQVLESELSEFLTPTLEAAEAYFANGALRYRFDLKLTEGVSIPHREMRDHAFSVTNGFMVRAKRIHMQRTGGNLYSNHWRMWVAPDDETKPVTVTLRGNRPCSEKGALCTGDGVQADSSPTLTLSTDTEPPDLGSLPSLSIADTSGTEDSANLAFDVSLSKAVSATIAVDFRTISGGTATANVDYQEANYRIIFSPGETVQPGSVGLMEDAANDAGETVKVEITNARLITPRGAEFGPLSITTAQATGTINAPTSTTTPLSNVNMRIENTRGSERGGWLHFTIKLSRALDENVCYDFETLDTGSASEGVDFAQRPKSTLWQLAGVTEWTEFVYIFNDSIDDSGETVKVRISDAELCDDASKTVTISRGEATGTITNDDPMPQAWLARLGRTVADQVIEAAEARMQAPRVPGTGLSLAGQRVGGSVAPDGPVPTDDAAPAEAWPRGSATETIRRGGSVWDRKR